MQRKYTVEIIVDTNEYDGDKVQRELIEQMNRIFGFGVNDVEVTRMAETTPPVEDPAESLVSAIFGLVSTVDSLASEYRNRKDTRPQTPSRRRSA